METKEELWGEYAKWIVEYVEAHEAFGKLLPTNATSFVSWAQIDEAEERMNNAWRKAREVLQKLHKHGSQ